MSDDKFPSAMTTYFVGEHVRASYHKQMPSGDVKVWVATGQCLEFSDKIVVNRDGKQGLIMFQAKHLIDIEQTPKVDD